ncbi:hypothetical protein ES705_17823 [subsurface metagenome]
MLTPEEQKKVRYYSAIVTEAGGDLTVLAPEESRELASLVEKWSQQEHSPSALPEPYQTMVRRELRKMPTWKLREAHEKLKGEEPTDIELLEQDRAYAISAVEEVLWERGKLERGAERLLPMLPEEGPPLPRGLELRWPWKKD